MKRARVAVLISGRGSNLRALSDACAAPDFPAGIVLVFSNREEAEGLAYARAAGIPTKVISHTAYASREEFDAAIDAALTAANVELICEAGFMRIHSEWFVRKWEGRIVNIHPSLLPAFPGIRVHRQVLDARVKVSGCTVHFMVPELDAGPIILQAEVPVLPGDTVETLSARVLEQEHRLYPQALRLLAEGKVCLVDGKAVPSHPPLEGGSKFA
jgi:phosphoribosylglycinamide formyltransferase 1